MFSCWDKSSWSTPVSAERWRPAAECRWFWVSSCWCPWTPYTTTLRDEAPHSRNVDAPQSAEPVHVIHHTASEVCLVEALIWTLPTVGKVAVWRSGNSVGHINRFTLRRALLGGATGRAMDLRSTGHGFKSYSGQKLRNNLGQVVDTYVALSPSSITCYRPRGGDALRLGK